MCIRDRHTTAGRARGARGGLRVRGPDGGLRVRGPDGGLRVRGIARFGQLGTKQAILRTNPVSYTHLDVYKRQPRGCSTNHEIE